MNEDEGWLHILTTGSKPVRLHIFGKLDKELRVGTIHALSEWVPVHGIGKDPYIVWANQRHYLKDIQQF